MKVPLLRIALNLRNASPTVPNLVTSRCIRGHFPAADSPLYPPFLPREDNREQRCFPRLAKGWNRECGLCFTQLLFLLTRDDCAKRGAFPFLTRLSRRRFICSSRRLPMAATEAETVPPVAFSIDIEDPPKSSDTPMTDEELIRDQGQVAGSFIRVFAIVRLCVTILATGALLQYYNLNFGSISEETRGDRERDQEESNRLNELKESGSPNELIMHLYYKEKNRLKYEDERATAMFSFLVKLSVNALDIFITSLLWAGSFANKKNCLPIYAILEAIFAPCILLWWIKHISAGFKEMLLMAVPVSLLGYVIFCACFIPLVLKRYYEYLDRKDREMKKFILIKKEDRYVLVKTETSKQVNDNPETQTLLDEEPMEGLHD